MAKDELCIIAPLIAQSGKGIRSREEMKQSLQQEAQVSAAEQEAGAAAEEAEAAFPQGLGQGMGAGVGASAGVGGAGLIIPDLAAGVDFKAFKPKRPKAKPPQTEVPKIDLTEIPEKTAVIVFHGMGQQMPFETINNIVQVIREEDGQQDVSQPPPVFLVKSGEDFLPRAEIQLAGSGEEIHVYEAYWAPATEGQVTALETITFLLGAGLRGMQATWKGFTRWMFKGEKDLKVGGMTFPYLLLAVLTVSSMVYLYLAFTTVTFVYLGLKTFDQVAPAAINAVWRDFFVSPLALSVPLVLFMAGKALSPLLGFYKRNQPSKKPQAKGPQAEAPKNTWAAKAVLYFLVFAFLGFLFWSVIHITLELFVDHKSDPGLLDKSFFWKSVAFWIPALAMVYVLKELLIQYVGDCAAYLSANSLNKFWEIRQKIQAIGLKAARAVYGQVRDLGTVDGRVVVSVPAGKQTDKVWEYDKVVIVGHSLGSVLAYDTLNAMIREDFALGKDPAEKDLDVTGRTTTLLTYGSPLDKTAFLFQSQTDRLPVREALAQAMEPLVTSYDYRPPHWINVYAAPDWISGFLNYYDARPPVWTKEELPDPQEPKMVQNIEDKQSCVPLLAHVQYDQHYAFRRKLYQAVVDFVEAE